MRNLVQWRDKGFTWKRHLGKSFIFKNWFSKNKLPLVLSKSGFIIHQSRGRISSSLTISHPQGGLCDWLMGLSLRKVLRSPYFCWFCELITSKLLSGHNCPLPEDLVGLMPLPPFYVPGEYSYYTVKWKSPSHVGLFATPWTIQSAEFSRPEYWNG